MKEKEQMKKLLEEVTNNPRKVIELEKFSLDKVVKTALDNKLFESLIIIFQPITIGEEVKIYFDAFSSNILDRIDRACDSLEEAIIEAQKEYDRIQSDNSELPEDDIFCDKRCFEEILESKEIIPKHIKESLINAIFTIDFENVNKIKVKNSHARKISGFDNPIKTINDVIVYAEPACLMTCIDLFNKNIKTTSNDTLGVIEDGSISNGNCEVMIDYNSLSQENKDTVEELIVMGCAKRFMRGDTDSISIFVPCNGEETIGEVSQKLLAVASKFKMQDLIYEKVGTAEEVYQKYLDFIQRYPFFVKGCFNKGITPEGIIQFGLQIGKEFVYDEEDNMFWDSPEAYQRHINYISYIKSSTPNK